MSSTTAAVICPPTNPNRTIAVADWPLRPERSGPRRCVVIARHTWQTFPNHHRKQRSTSSEEFRLEGEERTFKLEEFPIKPEAFPFKPEEFPFKPGAFAFKREERTFKPEERRR